MRTPPDVDPPMPAAVSAGARHDLHRAPHSLNALPGHSWLGFVIVGATIFVLALSVTLPTALYSSYAVRFSFGSGVLTLIFAAYVGGNVVVLLGLGGLGDRLGYRPVLFAAVLTAIAGTVLFLFADGVWELLLARFVQGLALGLEMAAATGALVELHPTHDHHAAALTSTVTMVSGQGLGALAGGAFGEWLPDPFRFVWVVYLAALATGTLSLIFVPAGPRRSKANVPRTEKTRMSSSMRRMLVVFASGAFAMSAVVGLYSSVTPTILHTSLGLPSLALAGTVTFVLMLASVVAQVLARRVASRTAAARGLVIVSVGLFVVTTAAAIPSLPVLLLGSAIAGTGQGMAFAGLLAGVSNAAPDRRRGRIVSSFYLATWLGAAVPVLAVGFAAPVIGLLAAAWTFSALMALISLGATVALLTVTPRAGREGPGKMAESP